MGVETVDLPDGGWAKLRDPKQVSERQRRPVTRLQARIQASTIGDLLEAKAAGTLSEDTFDVECRRLLGSDDWQLLAEVDDALIGALVAEWSYDQPPSADAALDLTGPVYAALKQACAKHLSALSPSFTAEKGALGDAGSPTGGSAG